LESEKNCFFVALNTFGKKESNGWIHKKKKEYCTDAPVDSTKYFRRYIKSGDNFWCAEESKDSHI